ncbi:MAG: YlmC/YmxH family sporulation protein [Porcipelethomonas sp.]
MIYGLTELKSKEVINVENGEKLGFIDDIEFESESGSVVALVIFGRNRLWGLLGKDEDIVLSCRDIELIGKDTVLVRYKAAAGENSSRRKRFFAENLFEKNRKKT